VFGIRIRMDPKLLCLKDSDPFSYGTFKKVSKFIIITHKTLKKSKVRRFQLNCVLMLTKIGNFLSQSLLYGRIWIGNSWLSLWRSGFKSSTFGSGTLVIFILVYSSLPEPIISKCSWFILGSGSRSWFALNLSRRRHKILK